LAGEVFLGRLGLPAVTQQVFPLPGHGNLMLAVLAFDDRLEGLIVDLGGPSAFSTEQLHPCLTSVARPARADRPEPEETLSGL
jgi:hypothetical protein